MYYIVIAQDHGLEGGYEYHHAFGNLAGAENFAKALLTRIAGRDFVDFCHIVEVERLLVGEISTHHSEFGLGGVGVRDSLMRNMHVGREKLRQFCARHFEARAMYAPIARAIQPRSGYAASSATA